LCEGGSCKFLNQSTIADETTTLGRAGHSISFPCLDSTRKNRSCLLEFGTVGMLKKLLKTEKNKHTSLVEAGAKAEAEAIRRVETTATNFIFLFLFIYFIIVKL
jgi:hypothetical protein